MEIYRSEEVIEYLRNLNLKKVFIIFTLTNFISLFLHVFSHYVPFITREVDYVLYFAKVVVMIFVYRAMERLASHIKEFNKVRIMLKILILCEFIEIYFAFMSGNVSLGIIPGVLGGVYLVKMVIEFLIYYCLLRDICNNGRDGAASNKLKLWCCYNFFIGVIFILLITQRLSIFLYLVYVLFIIQTLIVFTLIKSIADVYENECCKIASIKEVFVAKFTKSDIGKMIIVCVFVVATLVARHTYTTGFNVKEHINDEGKLEEVGFEFGHGYNFPKEHIFQYSISNLMPEWTGLCNRKYGLYSFTNDIDTGIVYSDEIFYDIEGLGYDGDGHIIDEKFNVLFDTPESMKIQKTYRQMALDNFIEWCGDNDEDRFHFSIYFPIYIHGGLEGIYDYSKFDYCFFRNGIGCYYSEFNNCYGLISDEGKVLTPPEYRYLRVVYDEPYAIVLDKDYQINVLDKNGKVLIDDTFGRITGCNTHFFSAGIIEVEPDEMTIDGHTTIGASYYINVKGEIMPFDYDFEGADLNGDVLNVKKKGDYQNIYVFGEDGRVLFISDKYLTYEGYRNSEGKITCLLVESKTDYSYGIIDLNGNLISKEWYPRIDFNDKDRVYECYSGTEKDSNIVEEIKLD